MSLTARLNRPEYLFNPLAVVRRLREGRGVSYEGETATARLPWSQEASVFPDEIGRMILLTGVFDVCVTETIYRLVERSDHGVDVGANVGYLTNLIATRAGPEGRVDAFEPHPHVFAVLEENVGNWERDPQVATVRANRIAISNESGTGTLEAPGAGDTNMGLSALRASGAGSGGTFEVEIRRLDDVLAGERPQLLKIDVEGHEREVLEGGERVLGGVRDVVFEEHEVYPAPSMTLLESRGMTLFTLRHTPFGLRVHPVEEGPAPPEWPGPNYLATRDPERAISLLRPRGWQCLGGLARLGRAAN